nr:hypothetical protein Itr_chr05CG04230 [Ipomoea trifida]GMC95064.1 hypothetical protein Iba_chr05cCG4920 [Ipomoea batatas]
MPLLPLALEQALMNAMQSIKLSLPIPFISNACDLLHRLFRWGLACPDKHRARVVSLMADSASPWIKKHWALLL